MVYVNDPATEGIPFMVTTFAAQLPVTPEGKPANATFVAPVVL